MSRRRILSLWFPRLAAERQLRADRGGVLADVPFAIAADRGNMQVLVSLSPGAEAEGLRPGQPLRDAQAMCARLVTRLANPQAEAAFLAALVRWAGRYSPWVAPEPPAGLVLDITGCAHLFGGEEAMAEQIDQDSADLGLSVQIGIADTLGAAWAVARYGGQVVPMLRSGDAIDMEAPATRARAAKRRHWERGGAAPGQGIGGGGVPVRIVPPGQTRQAIAELPVGALRIDADTATGLGRVGLRRIGDLIGVPRASLARRFGQPLVERLDQALGVAPEPISPARARRRFAVRLTLPEPIGLDTDIVAAIDRLLPALEQRLRDKGQGARRVRMQLFRADNTMQGVEVGLARPSADPDRIKPLLLMKLPEIDAGFGIDAVRIEAVVTEPVHARQMAGHAEAAARARARIDGDTAMDDLIGRLGARVGMDRILRLHPADTHIPEKTVKRLAAAWSEPYQGDWPLSQTPRPLLIWHPEPVTAPDRPIPPARFRWRGRDHEALQATGPERIAPEWWLDDPNWRSGVRDYWRVITARHERLWLYYAHGGTMSAGWFCQGAFA